MATTQEQKNETKMVIGIAQFVRLSFVHLFRPTKMSDDAESKEKYSVSILIPKNHPQVDEIKAKIELAKQNGMKGKFQGKLPVNWKNPLRDGDEKFEEDPEKYAEYKGHYYINASSGTKPTVVDGKRQNITDETQVYSGCWGRVSVNFYPFNSKGNKGVAAGLNNVQKAKDGEALGGKPSAEEDFGDLGDIEEDVDDIVG
jgi:hypothetical protein